MKKQHYTVSYSTHLYLSYHSGQFWSPLDRSRGNKCGRAESARVVVTFRCRIDVHRRRTESNWNLGSDTAAGNDPITSLAPMYPNAQPTEEQ